MPKYGMVIDLQKCVGCGACAFACKAENNTRDRGNNNAHNWADFVTRTEGVFPKTTQIVLPVLCNHCDEPACIPKCPVVPSSIFKTPDGFVIIDHETCTGCKACQQSCPYSSETLDDRSLAGETYSVLSLNNKRLPAQPRWEDKTAMIAGCTSAGAEVAKAAGAPLPAMNGYESSETQPVRERGVMEKCTFCYHRVTHGLLPACVEVCPSKARIFGDLKNPKSEIAQVLKKQKFFRLQEDQGTKPNVYYINKYSVRA
ncbi:MAG: 4Fe-4S dicluster domain-containing protein [Rhodocyclaceae bacterium]|nr:4Fe-4S dicluster domain-containing protein [Rhodocyclaceae bacterium]